jgi:hypothetical protein
VAAARWLLGATTAVRGDPDHAARRSMYPKTCIPSGSSTVRPYCTFAHKSGVVLLTHCHQKCVRKEISKPGFLDVSRYNVLVVHPIDLRRAFLCYIYILIRIFDGNVHARGCTKFSMVGCMGRISHTNFKNRMVISRIATSKNHIELLVPGQI